MKRSCNGSEFVRPTCTASSKKQKNKKSVYYISSFTQPSRLPGAYGDVGEGELEEEENKAWLRNRSGGQVWKR